MATLSNDPNTGTRYVDAGSAQRPTDTAKEAVDRLSGAASQTVDRVADRAQDTLDSVAGNASEYASRGRQLVENTRDWITAYPWRTVGIAAAAGFLIVRMMR